MLKKGDKFKEAKTGIVYTVKAVTNNLIMLETEDGLGRMLINPDSLDSSFMEIRRKEGRM